MKNVRGDITRDGGAKDTIAPYAHNADMLLMFLGVIARVVPAYSSKVKVYKIRVRAHVWKTRSRQPLTFGEESNREPADLTIV